MDSSNADIGGLLGGGEVNRARILYEQINRVNYLGSRDIENNEDYLSEWQNSIMQLADNILPFIEDDKVYQRRYEEIKNLDDNDELNGINEFRQFFRLMIKIGAKKGLFPSKRGSFEV